MSLSPSQPVDEEARRLAAGPGRNWILRAPAGSGKTTLLVTRYLELLNIVEKPEEILAITFTRKATAEMRERILASLSDPDSGQPPSLADAAKRARLRGLDKGWEIVANPSRLKIQTIESFRRSLVEASPVEAGVAPHTQLVQNAGYWYEEAVDRVFRSLKRGDSKAACLARLLELEHHNLSRVRRQLVDMLAKRDQWSGKLDARDAHPIEAASPVWLQEKMHQLWTMLKNHISISDLSLILDTEKRSGAEGFLHHPATWRSFAAFCLTDQGTLRRRLNPAMSKAAKQLFKPLLNALSGTDIHLLQAARLFPDPSPTAEERERLSNTLACLELAQNELRALFQERGTIDLVELGFGATRSLGNDELPTDLIIALDYSIKHILVDEFQDTSVTQTEFLHSLIREWMPGDGRSFFAVGDPMQSIYGFREAEVGLFSLAEKQGVGQVIDTAKRAIELNAASLETNFRSDAQLVEWVNSVFPQAMGSENDLPTGSVRFEPAVSTKSADPSHEQLGVQAHLFQSQRRASDADDQETRFIATYAAKLLKKHKEDRVAILLRNRTYASQLLQALRKRHLAYQGSELDRLADEPVVLDILALAKSIASPSDRLANFALLRCPAVGLTLASLHRLAKALDRGSKMDAILEDATFVRGLAQVEREALDRLLPLLKGYRAEYYNCSPRPLIERAWVMCGLASLYADARSLSSAEALFALIEAQQLGWIDFQALARDLRDLYAPSPSDARLLIMTIHQAKGLEFDHVILPFASKPSRADEKPSLRWRQSEEGLLAATRQGSESDGSIYAWLEYEHKARVSNETKRLLYVAATRAKKSLCLTGTLPEGSIGRRQGKPILTKKARLRPDTLITPIWNEIRASARLHPGRRTAPKSDESPKSPNQFKRLPSGYVWRPEMALTDIRLAGALGLPGEERNEDRWRDEPEGLGFSDWRSHTSASVGNVVHEGLKWLSEHPSQLDAQLRVQELRPLLHAWLTQEWLEGKALDSALRQVIRHLVRALKHRDCQWILSPHDSARSESALTTLIDNRIVNLRVDRTFIEKGTRFIIDYKTAKPRRKETRVEFRERQIREHAPQLQRYAAAFQQLEKLPITAALFLTHTPELLKVPLGEITSDECNEI